jgi:hypothetical protein
MGGPQGGIEGEILEKRTLCTREGNPKFLFAPARGSPWE